ncbi:MAG: transporter [Gammaproteobacteria bacterium]
MKRIVLPVFLFSIPSAAMADHLSGGFGLQSAAPFWTESAQTLKKGQFSFGLRTQYQKLRPFSDNKLRALREADALANPSFYPSEEADHHSDETGHEHGDPRQADLHSVDYLLGGSFRFAYGITDKLTIGFRLPFVYRDGIREIESGAFHEDGDFHAHEIFNHGSSEGVGDMSFWGQYQLLNGGKQTAAILLGFKAPTGETNNTGAGYERLETHLQPGSGSWDGMFGLAYGYDFDVVKFNTSAVYTLATKGSQDSDLGDTFNYNFAASLPVKYFTPCADCSWNFVLEANGEWRDHEERGHITIVNSGGHTVYISPGIRFISGQNWNVGASFGYPVITDWNGDQSEPDYRVMGAFNIAI